MVLSFLGQKKQTKDMSEADSLLHRYLSKIKFLQEFDVKVQKDKCLVQYNPNRQNLAKKANLNQSSKYSAS